MKFRFVAWLVSLFIAKPVVYSQHLHSLQYLSDFKSNEPSLAIEPGAPHYQFIGGNLDHYFLSSDGGDSWKHKTLRSTMGVYGDPVVSISASGRYYFAHLAKSPNKPYPASFDQIVFQFSDNRGQDFNNGVGVGLNSDKMQDKPWFFVLSSPDLEASKDLVALCWTEFDRYKSTHSGDSARIRFALSQDGGLHFSEPLTLSNLSGGCMDDLHTPEGATPVILPDSSIHVTWAMDQKIWYTFSLDLGKTWSPQKAIADQKGGWPATQPGFMRTNMMPFLITDLHHHLHLVWGQYNTQQQQHIYLQSSYNNGESWTQAQRVSPAQNKNGSPTHNFLPFPCSDPVTGTIYVAYYSRPVKAQYFCEFMVSAWDPQTQTWKHSVQNPLFLTAGNDVFFGDYNAVDAYHGMVRAVWTHQSQGKVFLATAALNTKTPPKPKIFTVKWDYRSDSTLYFYAATPNKRTYKVHLAKESNKHVHFLSLEKLNGSWLPWKRSREHERAVEYPFPQKTNDSFFIYVTNRRGRVLYKEPFSFHASQE